jgi:hypothetical protein
MTDQIAEPDQGIPDQMSLADQELMQAVDSLQVLEIPPAESPVTVSEDIGERPDKGDISKSGPPKLDEWQDFFGRILIKVATDLYMDVMLRGIDESELSPSELAQLALTSQDRRTIAKPFAELAHKSKFARKHGREIISSADAVESAMILAKWGRRVSRIGAKHRPAKTPKNQHRHQERMGRTSSNGDFGSGGPLTGTISPPDEAVIIDGYSGN